MNNKFSFYVFYLFYLLIVIDLGCAKKEGDACIGHGLQGTCKRINDCLPAKERFVKQRIFAENCAYDENVGHLICCVEGYVAKPSSSNSRRRFTTVRSRRFTTPNPYQKVVIDQRLTTLEVGELSDRKCQEYAKYGFETILSPILLPGQTYINQSKCSFAAEELIIGGEKTKPYEFPHQALLGLRKEGVVKWQCGGSLISESFILSAAHCLSADITLVRLGELDYSTENDETNHQDFGVSQTFKHPDYKPPARYNDIMLLKLDKPAVLNKWVRPACLHTSMDILPRNQYIKNPRFIATGWGRTHHDQEGSTHLLKVVVERFTQEECTQTYRYTPKRMLPSGIVDELQICAGGRGQIKDTCQGDSGGPIQIYSRKATCMYEIIGITSFGKMCGVEDVPSVYTRVSAYIDWIEKIVWKN